MPWLVCLSESTYDYVQGGLQANGEDAVKKNNPLFYYLNFASRFCYQVVGGEKLAQPSILTLVV